MKHSKKNGGLRIFKDRAPDATVFWHLYDCKGFSIFTFFDFIAYRITSCRSAPSEIESCAYSLKMWFEYLDAIGLDQFSATDRHLEEFKARLLNRLSSNLKDNTLARRRSINNNLRVVYKFYEWLQRHHETGSKQMLLGAFGCNITSTLLENNSGNSWNNQCYPLLFKNAGKGSKHKITHVPNDLDRAATTEFLHATQGTGAASRNVLLMDIAAKTGLRRGSILSLLASKFTQGLLDMHERTNRPYLVEPKIQKFSYGNQFEFRPELVIRIINYIKTDRAEIIAKTKSTSDHLFLSVKTGRPLTMNAATNVFTRAARALELPKDSGLHGHRRHFANDYLQTSYEASLETGGDTSMEMLSAITASALGHSNTQSQEAYLRDMLRRFKHTHALAQRDEVARLKDENARLRAELSQAKKKSR